MIIIDNKKFEEVLVSEIKIGDKIKFDKKAYNEVFEVTGLIPTKSGKSIEIQKEGRKRATIRTTSTVLKFLGELKFKS